MRTFGVTILALLLFVQFGCSSNELQQLNAEQKLKIQQPGAREIDGTKENITKWKYIVEKQQAEEAARIAAEEAEKKAAEEARRKEELAKQEASSKTDQMIKIVMANGEFQMDKQFFNQVVKVDGVNTIQNPTNLLVLANKTYYLPSNYRPDNLVQPNVPFVFQGAEQNFMRKEAADALEDMFATAKEEGINLIARSGFRSYQTQEAVFNREVNEVGYDQAILAVAVPGTSEHQTGLTMDITANSVNQQLVEEFGKTKEGIWLRDNAHRFGFILRYPEGKEDITKYMYEPWHFRYIGIEAATIIYENDWTLEEFFRVVKGI
ncbi:M15 family metallopeptidase [Caldibacillus lycopersici]|uniref:M15 family metallopeptidase n=1 Tax=Perspicuibacillus lycopersici TaxID=1325689 RepID=A0AAE3LLY3_9BACI|nr:M15 family metallopeptidase [Perspicuibacillus lycopersici]MCU9612940.1 M15 family metallopeptidase [Perspicuibacillus lycopersici]